MPKDRSSNIDTLLDFEIANFINENMKILITEPKISQKALSSLYFCELAF